ncbi:MAG: zinc-ribbon domain-containing protein [Thermoplasmata archaeon]
MTDKCEYCGDSLADDWVACPKCGKPKYGGVPLVEIVKAPRKTNA